MPLKINGTTISTSAITSAVIAIFWLAALSFQVNSNAQDVEDLADTKVRLARMEEVQKAAKEDITEIKEEQKEQSKMLDKILEKVSE